MKKGLSLILVALMIGQTAFASTQEVSSTAQQLVAGSITADEAFAYVQAHVSPAEFERIAQAMQDAHFAGTLAQDMDQIVASVQLQESTGSYLHGANYKVLKNVAIAVGVVVVVGLVLSSGGIFMPAMSGGNYILGDGMGYFVSF